MPKRFPTGRTSMEPGLRQPRSGRTCPGPTREAASVRPRMYVHPTTEPFRTSPDSYQVRAACARRIEEGVLKMHPRPRPLVTLLLLALASTLALPGPSSAAHSEGLIAFGRLHDGLADIMVMSTDGSDPHIVPLGDPAEAFGIPVWSRDGSRLLISHVVRFDGGGNLLPFRPATVRPNGSDYRLLTIPSGPFDMDCPAWSRTGSHILCGFGGDPGVFRIRASDGGNATRLTTAPTGTGDLPTDTSPDGRQFVFLRFMDDSNGNGQVGVFIANRDGSGIRQVLPFGIAQAHEFATAHWSPDGRSIITSTTAGRLVIVRADGRGMKELTLDVGTTDYFAFEPNWSPDGRRIVFAMFRNGQEDLYTAAADGSKVMQITNTPDFENGPDWGASDH